MRFCWGYRSQLNLGDGLADIFIWRQQSQDFWVEFLPPFWNRSPPVKFSDDRIAFLAHQIRDGLVKGLAGVTPQSPQWVDCPDPDRALREVKKTLIQHFKVGEEVDSAVREKIASLKRGVAEGSREWEVLYRKYFEEESRKRGR